jgi:NADH:ubiquinone oxidoreductase subunit E
MQVNYEFHDELTTDKVDEILDQYAAGQTPIDAAKDGE